MELEPYAWRTLLQEELDLSSLQSLISTLSPYLQFDPQFIAAQSNLSQNASDPAETEARTLLHAMFLRAQSERSSLERVYSVRHALYIWLLPAVSLAGVLANAIWLLVWLRCFSTARRRRRARRGSSQKDTSAVRAHTEIAAMISGPVGETEESSGPRSPVRRQSSAPIARPIGNREARGSRSSMSPLALRATLSQPNADHLKRDMPVSYATESAAIGSGPEEDHDDRHAVRFVIQDQTGGQIEGASTTERRGGHYAQSNQETGACAAGEEDKRERSACALQLELYALTSIALLALSAGESILVGQFSTHPSTLHAALCRLWPLFSQLLLNFPPVALIPALFHKAKVLRRLALLGNYCRAMHGHLSVRRKSLHAAALTSAEQNAASCARLHRLGFFSLYVVAGHSSSSSAAAAAGLLRPTPLIYGKLMAMLCAALLALSAVHTVWQHTIIASNGRRDCVVSPLCGYFFSRVWPRVQLCISSVAPALVLLVLAVFVLVHSLRLQLNHRQMLDCTAASISSSIQSPLLTPASCAAASSTNASEACNYAGAGAVSGPNTHSHGHSRRAHQQAELQLQQLNPKRLADARRECVELAHLLPTAIAVAFTHALHLSLLVFYTQNPFATAISGPASSASANEPSEESSAAEYARARHLSLALLGTQIAILAVHAAVLPLVSLLCSPHEW